MTNPATTELAPSMTRDEQNAKSLVFRADTLRVRSCPSGDMALFRADGRFIEICLPEQLAKRVAFNQSQITLELKKAQIRQSALKQELASQREAESVEVIPKKLGLNLDAIIDNLIPSQ